MKLKRLVSLILLGTITNTLITTPISVFAEIKTGNSENNIRETEVPQDNNLDTLSDSTKDEDSSETTNQSNDTSSSVVSKNEEQTTIAITSTQTNQKDTDTQKNNGNLLADADTESSSAATITLVQQSLKFTSTHDQSEITSESEVQDNWNGTEIQPKETIQGMYQLKDINVGNFPDKIDIPLVVTQNFGDETDPYILDLTNFIVPDIKSDQGNLIYSGKYDNIEHKIVFTKQDEPQKTTKISGTFTFEINTVKANPGVTSDNKKEITYKQPETSFSIIFGDKKFEKFITVPEYTETKTISDGDGEPGTEPEISPYWPYFKSTQGTQINSITNYINQGGAWNNKLEVTNNQDGLDKVKEEAEKHGIITVQSIMFDEGVSQDTGITNTADSVKSISIDDSDEAWKQKGKIIPDGTSPYDVESIMSKSPVNTYAIWTTDGTIYIAQNGGMDISNNGQTTLFSPKQSFSQNVKINFYDAYVKIKNSITVGSYFNMPVTIANTPQFTEGSKGYWSNMTRYSRVESGFDQPNISIASGNTTIFTHFLDIKGNTLQDPTMIEGSPTNKQNSVFNSKSNETGSVSAPIEIELEGVTYRLITNKSELYNNQQKVLNETLLYKNIIDTENSINTSTFMATKNLQVDFPGQSGYYYDEEGNIVSDTEGVKGLGNVDVYYFYLPEKEFPAKEYEVSFDSDGGSTVNSQTVTSGSTVTQPTAPTKDGYTFKEWQLNGVTYDFSQPVTSYITLKAVYTKNEAPSEEKKKNNPDKNNPDKNNPDKNNPDKNKSTLPNTGEKGSFIIIITGLMIIVISSIYFTFSKYKTSRK